MINLWTDIIRKEKRQSRKNLLALIAFLEMVIDDQDKRLHEKNLQTASLRNQNNKLQNQIAIMEMEAEFQDPEVLFDQQDAENERQKQAGTYSPHLAAHCGCDACAGDCDE